MRRSPTISRPLAFKGILTDIDGDGVADCDRRGNAAAPAALPEGPPDLLTLDFANETYAINGVSKTEAEVIEENVTDWAAFSDVGPGGLLTGQQPVLTTAAAAVLADGFILILDYQFGATSGAIGIDVANPPSWDEDFWGANILGAGAAAVGDSYGVEDTGWLRVEYTGDTDPHRAATLLAPTKISASVDGGAAEALTVSFSFNPTLFAFTVSGHAATKITKARFLAVDLDADLPALSALN